MALAPLCAIIAITLVVRWPDRAIAILKRVAAALKRCESVITRYRHVPVMVLIMLTAVLVKVVRQAHQFAPMVSHALAVVKQYGLVTTRYFAKFSRELLQLRRSRMPPRCECPPDKPIVTRRGSRLVDYPTSRGLKPMQFGSDHPTQLRASPTRPTAPRPRAREQGAGQTKHVSFAQTPLIFWSGAKSRQSGSRVTLPTSSPISRPDVQHQRAAAPTHAVTPPQSHPPNRGVTVGHCVYDSSLTAATEVQRFIKHCAVLQPKGSRKNQEYNGIKYKSIPEMHLGMCLSYLEVPSLFNKAFNIYGKILRPDAFLPEHRAVIEYDGEPHFRPIYGEAQLVSHQKNDMLKDKWFAENEYYVLRIHFRQKAIKKMYRVLTLFLNGIGQGIPKGIYGDPALFERDYMWPFDV